MTRLLVVDSDTILYSSAAQQQENKCNVIHKASGREKLFDSKTLFNEWIKSQDKWNKEEFDFQTVSNVVGEPRFAFQSVKQKVEKIIEAAQCDDFVLCIEGEGNFRKDFEAKYVDYKGQRTDKPLLFNECREFFLKKYKDKVIEAVGKETDDVVNALAWQSYKRGFKSRDQSKANVVLAYVDKDIAANSRGWLLNYNKLEEGIYWNDSFTQSKNFAVQILEGDSADNIYGIEKLSDITRERFNIRVKGVGKATANKILADCKTEKELAMRVYECYTSSWEDSWYERMNEMGFFLYLLRSESDKWSLDNYLKTGLK